jgi:hypothetical protein
MFEPNPIITSPNDGAPKMKLREKAEKIVTYIPKTEKDEWRFVCQISLALNAILAFAVLILLCSHR